MHFVEYRAQIINKKLCRRGWTRGNSARPTPLCTASRHVRRLFGGRIFGSVAGVSLMYSVWKWT
jgi:hypothetical protein